MNRNPTSGSTSGAYLLVTGGVASRVVALTPGSLVVGRSSEADLELSHVEISRRHCRFSWDGKQCAIEDMGSTRGTRVNGALIYGKTPLAPGDEVAIGPAILEFGVGEPPEFDAAATETRGPQGMLVHGEPANRIVCDAQLTIGRDAKGDVVLDDPSVSRRHAQIRPLPQGGVLVADLNSSAGSFVNGHRFDEHELTVGDRLQIGPFCFTFDGQALGRTADVAGGAIRALGVFMRAAKRAILDDITVSVPASRFVGIIGPSGAGKSSLLHTLAGFCPPASGVVLVDGEDIYAAEVRHSFGFVPQDDIVHRELTVAEALRFSARLRLARGTPRQAIEKLILQTLEQLGLRGFADRGITQLSGGQRKRVSVGVELLVKPAILFLDEPSSGLDPATEFDLMEVLRDLADTGCTIVCTTHVMENAWLIDQLIVLVGGCLAFQGAPQETREFFGVTKLTGLYQQLETRTPKQWQEATRQREVAAEPESLPQARTHIAVHRAWALPILLQRQWAILRADWRNFAILLGQPLIIAALVSWVSDDRSLILFFAYLATLWFGCSNAAQEIVKEIAIYRRERLVGVGTNPYLASKFLFLTTLTGMQSMILYVTVLALEGGPEGATHWQIAALAGTSFAAVGIGSAISALARSVMQAVMIVPLILIPLILFSGYTVPAHEMSKPVHTVSKFTPTFAAQTIMDTSFLWLKPLTYSGVGSHHISLSNIKKLEDVKTGELFARPRPALLALGGQALWALAAYVVAFCALKSRERA